MKQMTLWELREAADPVVNPIWEQLDTVVKMDTMTRLSLLMVKTVSPNHNEVQNKQENYHDG